MSSGQVYDRGLSSEHSDAHRTELKAHASLALTIKDVDISMA